MDLNRLLAQLDDQIASLKATRSDVAAAIAAQTGTAAPEAGDAFLHSWTDTRTPEQQQFGSSEWKPSGKIDTIKAIRHVTNLGLREAKEGVESCAPSRPFPLGHLRADQIQSLRDLGCVVEVKS